MANTFPRECFDSTTNWVKANHLCGNSPVIDINNSNITYTTENPKGNTHTIITSMKFNDISSNFSKFVITRVGPTYYSHYTFFNSLEELDCQKLEFGKSAATYTRFIDGSTDAAESKIKHIKNLSLINNVLNYCPIWNLTHLETMTDIYVYNSYFQMRSSLSSNTSYVKYLSFKPNCVFLGVEFYQYNLSRDAMISLFNALQVTSDNLTCVLGSTNLSKLTADEKKIATDKGWILS